MVKLKSALHFVQGVLHGTIGAGFAAINPGYCSTDGAMCGVVLTQWFGFQIFMLLARLYFVGHGMYGHPPFGAVVRQSDVRIFLSTQMRHHPTLPAFAHSQKQISLAQLCRIYDYLHHDA